jgi:hypothetical protein
MSVEKIFEPFPVRALHIPYVVLVISGILLLIGLLLFFLSSLFIPAIVVGGIGLFSLISVGIHYAFYRQEWKASRVLSEIENLLVGLEPGNPYAVGRQAHPYSPKLPSEKIPEVFEKLNERIEQGGQTGAMIICKKTAINLDYLIRWFIEWTEVEKVATEEQFTFQINFQEQLLTLFKAALTFYVNHVSTTDAGLNSKERLMNTSEIIIFYNHLIKLMNKIFVFHGDDWSIAPLDTIIDILILEFSLLNIHHQKNTILALCIFCENSLEQRLYLEKSLPDSLGTIVLQDEKVRRSFAQAQEKACIELQKLSNNNQIPHDEVTRVQKIFKKMPEKDPSFATLLTVPSSSTVSANDMICGANKFEPQ